jgi:hypothetical protein
VTAQTKAQSAVRELSGRLDDAEKLLQEFVERFAWLTEHRDYFERVEAFLRPATQSVSIPTGRIPDSPTRQTR